MSALMTEMAIDQIKNQCKYMRIYERLLEGALSNLDIVPIFCYIQGIMASADVVSRLLFPEEAHPTLDGSSVRNRLAVSPKSPFSELVGLELNIAHHLVTWRRLSEGRSAVELTLASAQTAPSDPVEVFSLLDPTSFTLIWCGKTIHLKPLLGEGARVLGMIEADALGRERAATSGVMLS